MNSEKIEWLSNKARNLTDLPGVYLMKNKQNEIIYVGKAKNLKKRVSSYFRSVSNHTPKVYKMVSLVDDFDYIVTDSEFEALVLECNLIKKHSPKYNILLKDDKGYSYIKVTKPPYSRISAVLQKDDDSAEYIGPYMSHFTVRQVVDEANRAFLLPTCHKKFPEDFKKGRPCLNFHIKQCMGVCNGKISQEEYADTIKQALDFIKQGASASVKQLEEKMNEAAENLEFEKAARLRDRIRAINKISDKQKIISQNGENIDAVAFARNGEITTSAILKIREGRLTDKQDFTIKETFEPSKTRAEFLSAYYFGREDIPDTILLDDECDDSELIAELLSDGRSKKVRIYIPQKSEKLRLVEMAKQNAAEKISTSVGRTGKEVVALDELGRLLGLENPPRYIEAYDISNLGETSVVAGMVVFENGRPLKSAYKKFSIKTIVGQDDYGAMREVISRRFSHFQNPDETDVGFKTKPDLILLDGGKGHISAVSEVLAKMKIDVPLFGMVKDSKHRTRAIAKSGGEISISANKSVFSLVTSIQDEVHRFAITFQRATHKKKTFSSVLTNISGVGEVTAKAIMQEFGSITAVKEASVDELSTVKGVSEKTAKAIYDYFRATKG